MVCVYKITSPTKKVYVGSTKNLTRRWRSYKSLKCASQKKLYKSLLKHGVDNHQFEIITECDINELLTLETHWGLFYNVLDKQAGLNLRLPKDGDIYGGFSKEQRVCGGDFKKGQVPWNKNLKNGQKAWNKGIPCKEETKLKLSISKTGKASKKKGIKTGLPTHNAKLILDFNTGVFYYSSADASNYSMYARQTINYMLNGKLKNKTNLRYV